MTLGEVRRMTMQKLNTIEASQEVQEILPFITKQSWTWILTHEKDLVDEIIQEQLQHVLEERLAGRPLAYIIGEWSFFGRSFLVNESVLIPREDTEVLVRIAINQIQQKGYQTALDLCTGSGCIGITLALETKAKIFASDISQDALLIAKKNAENLHVTVDFFASDLLQACPEKFDMIVSNPPYIPINDERVQKEVREFEPELALFAGEDGLDFYRRIAKEAKQYINLGGMLALEIGIDQYKAVKQLLIDNNWENIQVEYDFAGIERVIFGYLLK